MKLKRIYLNTQTTIMVLMLSLGFLSCGPDDNDEIITPPVTHEDKIPEIVLSNSGKVNGHDCVDLGLSVKWATCNIDANAPEDYGSYFAWGELNKKDSYTLDNYSLYQNGSYANYGNDISKTSHDAAYVKWGNKWRMPTYEEGMELIQRCTFSWETYKGTKGCLVTGPNGNKIFFPAAWICDRYNKPEFNSGANSCNFWMSTLWPWGNHYDITKCETAISIGIDYRMSLNGVMEIGTSYYIMQRFCGIPIRPVTTATPETSNDNNSDDDDNGGNNPSNETPYITSFTYTATKNSITVKFMATERPTSATIKYGENSATKTLSASITNKQISATATGLKAGTKYYFKCTVKNSNGSSTSDEYPAMTNY